jgi:arginine deiminase
MPVFIQDPAEVQPPEMAVFMGEDPPYDPARAREESARLARVVAGHGFEVVSPSGMLAGREANSVPLEELRALARSALQSGDDGRRRLADAAVAAWRADDLARLVLTQPSLELIPDETLREISPDACYEAFRISPLFGLMFPRDHFISLGRTVVPGRLVRQDRRREAAVMAACLRAPGALVRELPDDSRYTLEGGDFARNASVSLVGAGFRTSLATAEWLITNRLIETPWCVVVNDGIKRPEEFHMDHFLALGPDFALVSRERLDDTDACSCSVLRVHDDDITTHSRRLTLRQALEAVEIEALPLDAEEVQRFEANALFLGNDLMVAAETLSDRVASIVGDRGIKVEKLPFGEHHKQFGSVHCAAHPFVSVREGTFSR